MIDLLYTIIPVLLALWIVFAHLSWIYAFHAGLRVKYAKLGQSTLGVILFIPIAVALAYLRFVFSMLPLIGNGLSKWLENRLIPQESISESTDRVILAEQSDNISYQK